jgi:hypothetical protein
LTPQNGVVHFLLLGGQGGISIAVSFCLWVRLLGTLHRRLSAGASCFDAISALAAVLVAAFFVLFAPAVGNKWGVGGGGGGDVGDDNGGNGLKLLWEVMVVELQPVFCVSIFKGQGTFLPPMPVTPVI